MNIEEKPGVQRRHGPINIDPARTLVIDAGTVGALGESIARTPPGCHVAYSQNGVPSHHREKSARMIDSHTLVSKITSTRAYGRGINVEPGGVLLVDEKDTCLDAFERIFRDQGFFRLQAVADIRAAQYEKIAINCAINVSATVLGLNLGELLARATDDRQVRYELEGLAMETCRVSAAQGIRLAPHDDILAAMYALMADNPRHPTSMRQAFEAGLPTEIGVLNTAIVRLGRDWGVSTPLNHKMVVRLAALERQRDRMMLCGASALAAPDVSQHEEVETFHLLPSPGRLAQELQARPHAGVVREAAHRHHVAQLLPAVVVGQGGDDGLERQAVQGVAGLL